MFLGLPDPDPFVQVTDPESDPDPLVRGTIRIRTNMHESAAPIQRILELEK
jgi:hypothetical protein